MSSPASRSMTTRSATHRQAASFEPDSRARWATNAKITRSMASVSSRRPAADRCNAAPISSRPHSWSSTQAPPRRRESRMSTSAPAAAATASAGSRKREIEDTSRASAARSTFSARPKLWITVAVDTPVSG